MSNINKLIERVKKRIKRDELLKLTYELVKIKSITLQEKEISQYYYNLLKNIGLDVYYQEVGEDRKNVIGVVSGEGNGKSLLIGGHLDTIPFKKCVEPRIEGDKVYGRGAEDMKGSLAAMAIAAKALNECKVKLKGDLVLAAWVDHEAPYGKGKGPRRIAKMIKDGKLNVSSVIVAEGIVDKITIAQGGMAIFSIDVKRKGEGLHTSLIPLRSNPIIWASMVIDDLYWMDEELNEEPWHPLIPQRPSIQIGMVNGGDFYNRLPKECKIVGTIRWDPNVSFEIIKEELLKRIRRVEHRIWHGLDSSVNIDLDLKLVRDSYEINEDEEIVRLAKKALKLVSGNDAKVIGMRIVGDSSIFAKEVANLPTIAYGPSEQGKVTAHSDNEWIDCNRLEKVANVFATLAMLYCGVKSE